MIHIHKNQKWREFEKLFNKDIVRRYNWFLFEFGKRLTFLVHKELLGKISLMPGGDEYKKRLAVAEIRDRGNRMWWAIAARAVNLSEMEEGSDKILLTVVSKSRKKNDPVKDILEAFEPWTVDTIPFVPSTRQAIVLAQESSVGMVEQTRDRNHGAAKEYMPLMEKYKIDYTPRQAVMSSLRAVTDLEMSVLRQEFGLEEGMSHWRPAIRFARREGPRRLASDKELVASMTDYKDDSWKETEHLSEFLTEEEVREFERFQKKVQF